MSHEKKKGSGEKGAETSSPLGVSNNPADLAETKFAGIAEKAGSTRDSRVSRIIRDLVKGKSRGR